MRIGDPNEAKAANEFWHPAPNPQGYARPFLDRAEGVARARSGLRAWARSWCERLVAEWVGAGVKEVQPVGIQELSDSGLAVADLSGWVWAYRDSD